MIQSAGEEGIRVGTGQEHGASPGSGEPQPTVELRACMHVPKPWGLDDVELPVLAVGRGELTDAQVEARVLEGPVEPPLSHDWLPDPLREEMALVTKRAARGVEAVEVC